MALTSEIVKDIVASSMGVPRESVSEESKFKDRLHADSLDMIELIMSIEEELEIAIPDERCYEVKTVGDLIKLVEDIQFQNHNQGEV